LTGDGNAPRPTAAVLVTGNEILLGLTQDRNSGFLARALDALGFDLDRVLTVGDAQEDIENGLRELLGHDLVITSGGLGPTHDDRTVGCVAAVAGVELESHEPTMRYLEERTARFARDRGLDPASFVRGNRKQALVPRGSTVIPPVGTAPGLAVDVQGTLAIVLPGPPRELSQMWDTATELPQFRQVLGRAESLERHVLRVYGTSESAIADAFEDAGGDGGGTVTTICAHRFEVEVLVRAPERRRDALDHLVEGMKERLGTAVYLEDERSIEELVLDLCRTRGLKVATAESCTAGLVSARLASIPGSSDVLLGGVVSYANEVKHGLLGVSTETLETYGAVSAECAAEMAAGVRRATGADLGVSVTGVAGPGGGTEDKPVGLVYVHVSAPGSEKGRRTVFPGDRNSVRDFAATTALHLLRRAVTDPA
jgi:competence/damage-inducible protein CinA-like protein